MMLAPRSLAPGSSPTGCAPCSVWVEGLEYGAIVLRPDPRKRLTIPPDWRPMAVVLGPPGLGARWTYSPVEQGTQVLVRFDTGPASARVIDDEIPTVGQPLVLTDRFGVCPATIVYAEVFDDKNAGRRP
jgi:hypothetical protein